MKGSTTRFLFNDSLWEEIQSKAKTAKSILAAVAYVGTGGAKLVPLRKGHRLVCDMSLQAVGQGVTDPREIRKLIRKGVAVFSRSSLHAKFYVMDKTLIAGSANISGNSHDRLDEVGLMTTDAAAIRRAADLFDKLCTEPVLPEFLAERLKAYRPPKFKAAAIQTTKSQRRKQIRPVEAKVWFIGGLVPANPHERDRVAIEKIERKAEARLKNPHRTHVTWVRYSYWAKYLEHIRTGDWVVTCTKDGSTRSVSSPRQVLGQDVLVRHRRKKQYMLLLETRDDGEDMTISEFRRRVRSFEPNLDSTSPRTRPIVSGDHADRILRLWTTSGRISAK